VFVVVGVFVGGGVAPGVCVLLTVVVGVFVGGGLTPGV